MSATYGACIWLSGGADSNNFVNLALDLDTVSTSTNIAEWWPVPISTR